MNGRAEMLFTRSGLRSLRIKHQLATSGTTEKHSHCIRTLVGKNVSVKGHLWDCVDLDTSFHTLKRVQLNLKYRRNSSSTYRNSLQSLQYFFAKFSMVC